MLLIFFFIIFIVAVVTGKIKLVIKEINISNIDNKFSFKYDIILKIFIFKFIKIFQIKLNHLQSKNLIKRLSKTNLKTEKNTIKKQVTFIKRFFLRFNELQINIAIGIDDLILTVYTIAVVSSLIPIFIRNLPKTLFKVIPLYNMGNRIEIELKGISEIKFVHIIYVIFILFKERGNQYGRREWKETSNRRTYDHGNE